MAAQKGLIGFRTSSASSLFWPHFTVMDEQVDTLGKSIQDGILVRNAREIVHTGVIIALAEHGYISRDGDSVISVIDGVQSTLLTDKRQIITAATRGGNVVLLFADGELILLGHQSVHIDFMSEDIYDSVNDVYFVNIIVAADVPEAVIIVNETVTWVSFSSAGGTCVLDITPGSVIAFHNGTVYSIDPTLQTATTFFAGKIVATTAILLPAYYGEWKFAVACDTHIISVTETAVLLFTYPLFQLQTVYRIFGPADIHISDSNIYVATLLGELLCAPLAGGAIVSRDHIPSVHLNMRLNYDAGCVLCKYTDTRFAVLACNTRKLYTYNDVL